MRRDASKPAVAFNVTGFIRECFPSMVTYLHIDTRKEDGFAIAHADESRLNPGVDDLLDAFVPVLGRGESFVDLDDMRGTAGFEGDIDDRIA